MTKKFFVPKQLPFCFTAIPFCHIRKNPLLFGSIIDKIISHETTNLMLLVCDRIANIQTLAKSVILFWTDVGSAILVTLFNDFVAFIHCLLRLRNARDPPDKSFCDESVCSVLKLKHTGKINMRNKPTQTPNDQRANVKNPNNPAYPADQANRAKQTSEQAEQAQQPKTGSSSGHSGSKSKGQ